ncbi:MAG: hemin uptake protein HemP [Nitrosomonas sp. PRO4]|nr:hemin uptake protein HemP [Nitrosomonas sp. PRO4]
METLILAQTKLRNLQQSTPHSLSGPIDSNSLFKNTDVILILHNGEHYSLRRTRNGKLILNK